MRKRLETVMCVMVIRFDDSQACHHETAPAGQVSVVIPYNMGLPYALIILRLPRFT